jgi:hypothetical protein
MKKLLAAAALGVALAWTGGIGAQTGATTIVEGARIIDAVSSAPIDDAVIEIQDGAIRHIGKRGSFAIPSGATRVSLAGKTIVPGPFNVHVHIGKSASDEYSSSTGVSPIQRVANRHLYYGVTHIMSLGLDGPEMDAFQAAARGAHNRRARLVRRLRLLRQERLDPETASGRRSPSSDDDGGRACDGAAGNRAHGRRD